MFAIYSFPISMFLQFHRIRGPIWTDEEVHKLFHVWNQPDILNGFLNKKRKREVFLQVSSELNRLHVTRSWEECRAKIKNLKGEYKKAKESNSPQMFKHFFLMERVLAPGEDKSLVLVSSKEDQHLVKCEQPVQIEFEIVPTSEIDFRTIKTNLGIPHHNNSSIIIPHSSFMTSQTVDAHEIGHNHEEIPLNPVIASSSSTSDPIKQTRTSVEMGHAIDAEDGTPVIVITTTENPIGEGEQPSTSKSSYCSDTSTGMSPKRRPNRESSTTGAGNRQRKLNVGDINHKRRKLHQLSEKMAETVDRVLTKTTNALIEEMKASEDRFMEWEEKKRKEEQQREEKLLKSFVDALKRTSEPQTENECLVEKEKKDTKERQRMLEMIQSSDDPCAVTFDLLATRLTTMLNDQQRETEQNLYQWESKMQKQEMKHTENLFSMIVTAIKSHADSNDPT